MLKKLLFWSVVEKLLEKQFEYNFTAQNCILENSLACFVKSARFICF